jgi:hypothetical protein
MAGRGGLIARRRSSEVLNLRQQRVHSTGISRTPMRFVRRPGAEKGGLPAWLKFDNSAVKTKLLGHGQSKAVTCVGRLASIQVTEYFTVVWRRAARLSGPPAGRLAMLPPSSLAIPAKQHIRFPRQLSRRYYGSIWHFTLTQLSRKDQPPQCTHRLGKFEFPHLLRASCVCPASFWIFHHRNPP